MTDHLKSFDRHTPSPRSKWNNYTPTNANIGSPVRVVSWPEGAPDPATVPQAGDVVYIRQRYAVGDGSALVGTTFGGRGGAIRYIVANGIPYQRQDDPLMNDWRLRVYKESDRFSVAYPIMDQIVPAVEGSQPEKTYTTDEIVRAIKAINPVLAESICKKLEGGV